LVWPVPIITTIVGSFTEPGARVVLLHWPTLAAEFGGSSPTGAVGAGGVIDHVPGTLPSDELASAVDAVEELDRTATVIHLPTRAHDRSGSRPFWADLVPSPDSPVGTAAGTSARGALGSADGTAVMPANDLDGVAGSADLIITSFPVDPTTPEGGDQFRDHVALAAARLLRVGGILTVLTHSDWSGGVLIDPTGPIVAAAQNADLLYLQHIIALHTPIRDHQLIFTPGAVEEAQHTSAAHHVAEDGSPEPHQRSSSDVVVFAQPHDHQFSPLPPATAAKNHGVIR
jgi:hypothetical protein